MSATKTLWTCNHCGTEFSPTDSTNGPFCNTDCHHEFIGSKPLNQVMDDRRFCPVTFAQIRERHRQGRYAWSGSVLRDADGAPVEYRHAIPESAGDEVEELTTHAREMLNSHGCFSPEGALTHRSENEDIQFPHRPQDAIVYAGYLSDAVETLHEDESHAAEHELDVLRAEMWSFIRDGREVGKEDYARALGKAIAATN